jgi:hypothetical protein
MRRRIKARESNASSAASGGRYQTFVVRCWSEGARHDLRGTLVHVGSRDRAEFRDFERLLLFIDEHLDEPLLLLDLWRDS